MHILSLVLLELLNLCGQTKGRSSLGRKQAEALLSGLRQLQVRRGCEGEMINLKLKFPCRCLIPTYRPVPGRFFPVRRGLVGHHEPLRAQRGPASRGYVHGDLRGFARVPSDLRLSSRPSWQACGATGRWLGCCLSASLPEPCTCPSTALSRVSPGCAGCLVTVRLLSSSEPLK